MAPSEGASFQECFARRLRSGAGADADSAGTSGKKVVLLTLYDDKIADYAAISEMVNRVYARKHGMDMVTVRSRLSDRAPQWDKVKATQLLLDQPEASQYEFVMWIDADAAFADHSKDLLRDVVRPLMGSDKDVLICDDKPNFGKRASSPGTYVNTGTFVVRNSDWARAFLRKWWDTPMGKEIDPFHEQDVFNQLYARDPELQRKTVVADARVLNSVFGDLKSSRRPPRGALVVHMMQKPLPARQQMFRSLLDKAGGPGDTPRPEHFDAAMAKAGARASSSSSSSSSGTGARLSSIDLSDPGPWMLAAAVVFAMLALVAVRR